MESTIETSPGGGLGICDLEFFSRAMPTKNGNWSLTLSPSLIKFRRQNTSQVHHSLKLQWGETLLSYGRVIFGVGTFLLMGLDGEFEMGIMWMFGMITRFHWSRSTNLLFIIHNSTQIHELDTSLPNGDQWNLNNLSTYLHYVDILWVEKIPLISVNNEDLRIWMPSPKGVFSVKLAY